MSKIFTVRAAGKIQKADLLVGNHQTARGTAMSREHLPLFLRQMAAAARIKDAAVRKMGRLRGVQFRPAAKTGINKSPALQKLVCILIKPCALALVVWTVGAAPTAAFIPVKAKPEEILLELLRVTARTALRVEIFMPQNDGPMLRASREPSQKRTKYIAKMHPAARTRSKPPHRRLLFFHDRSSSGLFPAPIGLF